MRRAGPTTTAIGGALLTLGALLDWTGVPYSSTVDRGLAMVAGLLAVLVAILARRWAWAMWLGIVGAALGLNMGIVNYVDISTKAYEYSAYPNARVGVGIYVVLAGGVVVLAGTVLWLASHRRRPSVRSS